MAPSVYSDNARKNARKREEWAEFKEKMWGPMGEVVSMAEGRDGLVLGKVRFKRQMFQNKISY